MVAKEGNVRFRNICNVCLGRERVQRDAYGFGGLIPAVEAWNPVGDEPYPTWGMACPECNGTGFKDVDWP